MGPRLVRGRGPGSAGAALTRRPWWFGPDVLPAAAADAPFDLVLLDRDGTLNVRIEDGYVTRPDELVLLPGAATAVADLSGTGAPVVMVTNQRGIARGLMDRDDLVDVHARLAELLAPAGGWIDAVAVCPHDRDECSCRKPLDGLFREVLARAPWADPRRSVMIGDMPSDLEPATRLGMRAVPVGPQAPVDRVVARLLAPYRACHGRSDVRRGEGHVP